MKSQNDEILSQPILTYFLSHNFNFIFFSLLWLSVYVITSNYELPKRDFFFYVAEMSLY